MKMIIDAEMGWCPVCGELMKPDGDEVVGEYINEFWLCNNCDNDVTYAIPRGHSKDERYADGEVLITITPFAS